VTGDGNNSWKDWCKRSEWVSNLPFTLAGKVTDGYLVGIDGYICSLFFLSINYGDQQKSLIICLQRRNDWNSSLHQIYKPLKNGAQSCS